MTQSVHSTSSQLDLTLLKILDLTMLLKTIELRSQVQTMAYVNYNTTCNTIDKILRGMLPKGNTSLPYFP